jgi:hypothetical protein
LGGFPRSFGTEKFDKIGQVAEFIGIGFVDEPVKEVFHFGKEPDIERQPDSEEAVGDIPVVENMGMHIEKDFGIFNRFDYLWFETIFGIGGYF